MRPETKKASGLGIRWGAAFSAVLHLGVAAAILLVLPMTKKPKATPRKVPVEIVRPLEKKPEKKKKLLKELAKKKPNAPAKVKPKPAPKKPKKEAKPKPPKKPKPPEKKKTLLAKKVNPSPPPANPKPLPKPPEQKAEPKKAAPKTAKSAKEPPRAPKANRPEPPEQKPIAKKVEKQLAKKQAKPKPKGGGRKVKPKPDGNPQFSMIQGKLVGRWILQPLKVNLKNACGRASLTGVINLTRKRGNRFSGTLQTTIRWARCPPEGAIYQIVLVIRGNRVVMLDAGGVLDSGLIQGDIMMLKDAYGPSVWRRGK